jgi:leucyl aminopeptidase (aminopeptidase T)
MQERLREGADTVVEDSLSISGQDSVLVLNDSNDEDIVSAIAEAANKNAATVAVEQYEEPSEHGEEPPQRIGDMMKDFDVVVAPTTKSISHTDARTSACEHGARVATLPGITKQIWSQALSADLDKVQKLSNHVYSCICEASEVRVKTPSGTDVHFEVDSEFFHADTGRIDQPGDFGNLPAGEADGTPLNVNGKIVVDNFPFAPEGTEIQIEDSKAVSASSPSPGLSELEKKFRDVSGARNLAEFGFGTNPKAEPVGNILQDEKILGTVHFAFGDNSSYVPKGNTRRTEASLHWDTICVGPTVYFDDKLMLDSGHPVFMEDL